MGFWKFTIYHFFGRYHLSFYSQRSGPHHLSSSIIFPEGWWKRTWGNTIFCFFLIFLLLVLAVVVLLWWWWVVGWCCQWADFLGSQDFLTQNQVLENSFQFWRKSLDINIKISKPAHPRKSFDFAVDELALFETIGTGQSDMETYRQFLGKVMLQHCFLSRQAVTSLPPPTIIPRILLQDNTKNIIRLFQNIIHSQCKTKIKIEQNPWKIWIKIKRHWTNFKWLQAPILDCT